MFLKSLVSILLFAFLYGKTVDSQSEDIRIRFYTGPNHWLLFNVQNVHTVVGLATFINSRDTVFYHVGFSQDEFSENVMDVKDAYVTRGNVNFFLIYYLNVATNVITNAPALGSALAASYIRLANNGVPIARFHLVGFCLGATIQAIASRTVQSETNNRLIPGRLTGLDPMRIQAAMLPQTGRLSANDAAFVDSIHTEGIAHGDHLAIGHVHYMVNGGILQPFCTTSIEITPQMCSHRFAVTAWAESIRAQTPIFPSLQCTSWENFLANNCNTEAPVGNMGVHTSFALRGSYFLGTNNDAPFSRPQPGP